MNELTDLEICKKIAEIKGYKTSITDNKQGIWASFYKNDCYGWFNPLTDDALCFQLMIKFNVIFMPILSLHEKVQHKAKVAGFASVARSRSPNKAICLAIIEAHKDK